MFVAPLSLKDLSVSQWECIRTWVLPRFMKYQVLDPNTKYHQFPSQFQLVFPVAMVFCSVLCVSSGLSRRQSQETNQISTELLISPKCMGATERKAKHKLHL